MCSRRGNQQEKPRDKEGEAQRNRGILNWERRGKEGDRGGKTETERQREAGTHTHRLRGNGRERQKDSERRQRKTERKKPKG